MHPSIKPLNTARAYRAYRLALLHVCAWRRLNYRAALDVRNLARPLARARMEAMYLAVVACDCNRSAVARAVPCSRWMVSMSCARIEDARDARPRDRDLNLLERRIAA